MTSAEQNRIEAFTALVREHQAGLRAFVRALGVDEIWVDDIAQEAFLVAYRRQGDFETDADFGKWLRGIARHLVANERRKSARHSRLLHAAVVDALAAAAPDGSETATTAELLTAMRGCVGELPPRQRELLERRYARGENASELAATLRMTAEAVRQSLMRIRVAVKACVERKLMSTQP
jgi:RNA polymerase sigma-70 factor (ECF subfamily)